MSEIPPVFHANGRKAHLAPGLFHLCSWTNSRWEKGANFEVLSKAKDLANSCLVMGLAPRYVIIRPSGHEDTPDLIDYVEAN